MTLIPSFEELCDEVEASFVAFTGDASVQFASGQLAIAENAQQRRIVLVCPDGEIQPSTRTGSVDLGNGIRARMVKRDAETVVAHVYAESRAAAKAMLHNLVAACEATFGTGFQPGKYEWITQAKQAAHTSYTETIRMNAVWNGVILDRAEPLTQLEAQGHSCSFGDGDFDPGDFSPNDFLTAGGEAA